jgi:hypothetical protein
MFIGQIPGNGKGQIANEKWKMGFLPDFVFY